MLEFLHNATSHSQVPALLELSCEEVMADEDIPRLEEVLRRNHQYVYLTTLRLPKNNLTSAAAESLAKILQSTETLQHLDVRNNNLGSEGVARLIQPLVGEGDRCQCTLLSLNLANNNLKRKAAGPLADLLRQNTTLTEIYVGVNPLKAQGVKEIVNGLEANRDSKVSHLSLRATTLGGKGAGIKAVVKLINGNETIHSLDLSSNGLKSAGAIEISSALTYRNQLHELNLGGNDIGADGARALSRVLSEDGALQGYCYLTRLSLDWNQIGDEGAIDLAVSLELNSTLQYLDLSGNHISDRGAQHLAKTFTINFCLKEVHLNDNQIGDDGASALAQSMRRTSATIVVVQCENNSRMSERGEFILGHVFQYRESLNSWLGDLDKELEHDSLMSVDCWKPDIERVFTDWELQFLSNSLAQHKPRMLQSIWLAGNHVTDEGLQVLCDKYIGGDPPLQRLYMKGLSLGSRGMASLKSALRTNSTLRILSVTYCGLTGPVEISHLAEALKDNSTLESINLQGNNIDDEGFRCLWEAVKPKGGRPHPSLNALHVGNNQLTDVAMEVIAASGTVDLERLYLDGNRITDRGALDLSKAIMDSTSLKLLSIAQNDQMTHKGKNTLRLFAPHMFSC